MRIAAKHTHPPTSKDLVKSAKTTKEMQVENVDVFNPVNFTVYDDTELDLSTIDRHLFESAFCPSLHGFTPSLELSGLFHLSVRDMAQIRRDWPTTFTSLIDAYIDFLMFHVDSAAPDRTLFSPDEFIQRSGGFHTKEWLDALAADHQQPDSSISLMDWEGNWLVWRGMIRYFQKFEDCEEGENPPMIMGRRYSTQRLNRVSIS